MPPAKYLVRCRHSLAPEAIIWEGKVLGDAECPPKLVGAQPRRSRQFSNSSASSGGHAPTNGVAIDSKIEQAMDLVKTHLIYAVRDEIELLRSRILELETSVIRLEAENAILRENIPNEVLTTLCLDPPPPANPPKQCGAFANAATTATAIAQF